VASRAHLPVCSSILEKSESRGHDTPRMYLWEKKRGEDVRRPEGLVGDKNNRSRSKTSSFGDEDKECGKHIRFLRPSTFEREAAKRRHEKLRLQLREEDEKHTSVIEIAMLKFLRVVECVS
jgi:hypothetical protein